jgi:hypothetical protein
MKARVRADSRYPTCTAFGGREYVRYEWRDVPADGLEEAARRASGDDYLEFLLVSPPSSVAAVSVPVAEDKPAETAVPSVKVEKRKGKRGK